MQLQSFHVRLFRNVIDSGPIEATKVTCLVGKNEAGKSTLLEALHHLNPAKPSVQLDLLDQYPRWLKKEHEMSGEIDGATPITAVFMLDEDEREEMDKRFGEGVVGESLTAWRSYGGDLRVKAKVNIATFISAFTAAHVDPVLHAEVSSAETDKALAQALSHASDHTEDGEASPKSQAAVIAHKKLKGVLGDSPSITAAVHRTLRERVPKTFYFNNYSQLRGRYELEEVLEAVEHGSDEEEIQAAADFLALARVATEKIKQWEFEECNAELEGVSSLLTRRVKANWKQNQHLKLSVKIETVPSPSNRADPRRFLQFRVEDTRHDFSNKLDRRSTGFRWFVSFMAAFFEFEKEQNLLLLLDEPGLSLHARAQKDLLDVIEHKLAASRQVMYTTHSPFMVRTRSLQHVRVVEDRGPERGSVTTNEAGSTTDPDTLFPLQAALGYDIGQSLFIGERNVLVEGVSDFIFLSVISGHLAELGRSSLPNECRLLPCRGATNIATFIALLGEQLDVVVVLDGDAPRQRIDNAIADQRLNESSVIKIDNYSGVRGADIEDLFEPQEYIDLYNGCFGETLALAELKGTDRIVKRIERTKIAYDHGRVAGHFARTQADVLRQLSDGTLGRFESLIQAISRALEQK